MEATTQTRKVEIPGNGAILRSATFNPATIKEEDRTVELVWSTGAQVRRYSWWSEREWNEELSLDTSHVRLDRLNNGAPLLRDHSAYSITSVMGVVERAWIDGNEGRAVVRFAKDEESDAVFQKVKDGILRKISIGYTVNQWEVVRGKSKEDLDTYRAIDWEPYEISLVAVPADDAAQVRSAADGKFFTTLIEEVRMDANTQPQGGGNPTPTQEQLDAQVRQAQERAQAAERLRVKEINEAVRTAKLDQTFADDHIEKGTSVDEVRKLVIAEFGKKDPNEGARSNGANFKASTLLDERDKFRGAIENALMLRTGAPGSENIKDVGSLREFRGMSLQDMVRECAERAGINTRGMTSREIWSAATGRGEYARSLSTSDFPLITANVLNKTLLGTYALAERTFQALGRRETVADFKPTQRVRLGDASPLSQVIEGAEYTYGTSTEGKEEYSILKYGKLLRVTWEMMVNDDLSAFTRLAPQMALQVAQLQSDLVWSMILANPNMGDSVALFHATHGNLGTNAAIDASSLSAMRKAFRNQKSMGDGNTTGSFLNLMPSFLVVGPDKEEEALKVLKGVIVPNETANVNTITGMGLTPIVEPRITGNKWFGFCRPGVIDTFEYAFLRDEPEIFTDMEEDFKVDAMSYKVRTTFGCKAIDWRGMYYNPGA